MSEPTEVCFIIYCKGKFEITEGVTSYLGGDVSELVCPPQLLFPKMAETLGSSLYGQRIWYKLPYDDYTELKLLCNGNAMFEKMLEATEWCNTVQIFMEKDDDIDDGDGNGSGDNGGSSDRRSGDGVGDNSDEEILEEDARVEKNIEGFVDEEENHNDEVTPENSDCEDDDRHYERYKKGSGVLILGQAFDSLAEFKEAVVDYSLKDGFNVKFTRWGSVKSEVRCGVVAVHEDGNNNGADGNVVAAVTEKDRDGETENQTCPFRIYCSFEKSVGMYLIKTFEDEHSCIPDGYSKVVRGRVIAKLLLNEIRRDPKLKHKAMQEKMEEKYKIIVSNDQCRKAKRQALNIVQDEHDQQFARLKDYKMEVIKCNPESTVEVGTLTNESGKETFDRIYVCLAPLKRTWIAHCRPIFGIDGCFLKSNAQGQFLAAVGRDANNQLFPIAWAVVEIENTDSWLWFIQLLKNDLNLLDGTGFTLISDRQKGLIIAVEQLLPQVEHRMCARHIYGNLRRVYPGKELPKDLFWAVAKSFNNGEYEVSMKALKNFDVRVYEAVLLKNPQNFSRAFFTSTPVCEDVSNNFSESYNNTLNTAREMPLVEMLETVRRQAMVRMDMRKTKALRWQGKYSEKVVNTIKAEKKHLLDCRVIPSGNGIYEVGENNHPHTVDMSAKTCVCRRWSMTGIPCRHALRVILMKKLDPLDYVSHWYLTSTWRQQYNDPIRPVNGINFWRSSDKATIQPPPRDAPQPTKKQKKRIKGKNESPQKKKKGNGSEAPTKKRIKLNIERKTTYCGRCGLGGHNSRKCPNHGCPVNRPKKQPSGLSQGEGPSQASQNSNFG